MTSSVQKVGDIIILTDPGGIWAEDAEQLCFLHKVKYLVEVYESTLDIYQLGYGWIHSLAETEAILRLNKISKELVAEIILSNPDGDFDFKRFMGAWTDDA